MFYKDVKVNVNQNSYEVLTTTLKNADEFWPQLTTILFTANILKNHSNIQKEGNIVIMY